MTDLGQNQVPAAVRALVRDAGPDDNVMPEVRRSSRQSKPSRRILSMDDLTGEDEPFQKLSKRTKPAMEKTPHATLACVEPAVDPVGVATFVGPDQQAKQRKARNAKAALLNPPRQEDLQPVVPQPAFNPVQRAVQYISAKEQLETTLASLDFQIKKFDGQISIADLTTIHNQFAVFMETHPLFFPDALAAQAMVLGIDAERTQSGTISAASKAVPSELTIGDVNGLSRLSNGNLQLPPIWSSMPVSVAHGPILPWQFSASVPPPNAGQNYFPGHPYPSAGPGIGPEDSAAIARARATALMAGNGEALLGPNNFAVFQLLQALNNVGHTKAGSEFENIQDNARYVASLMMNSLKNKALERLPDDVNTAVPPFTRDLEERLIDVQWRGEPEALQEDYPEDGTCWTEGAEYTNDEDSPGHN